MSKFLKKKIDVCDVKDDFAIFKDGRVVAVFAVSPIDFFKLNEDQQLKIVCNYRFWLDNLEYPVQIVKRAVNWNNKEHLLVFKTKMETELKKRKKDSQEALANFREFYSWLVPHISKNCASKNLFYLVVPYLGDSKSKVLKDWNNVFKILDDRCDSCKNDLEKTGVRLTKLGKDDLDNLFSSYFDFFFVQNNKESYDNINSFARMWGKKGGFYE